MAKLGITQTTSYDSPTSDSGFLMPKISAKL